MGGVAGAALFVTGNALCYAPALGGRPGVGSLPLARITPVGTEIALPVTGRKQTR